MSWIQRVSHVRNNTLGYQKKAPTGVLILETEYFLNENKLSALSALSWADSFFFFFFFSFFFWEASEVNDTL